MDNQADHRDRHKESESISCIEEKFGYFGFAPPFLQRLNNPWWFLVGVIGLTSGHAVAILGILPLVMPQIEKRFNFSSSHLGMIAAANDFAAVVFGLLISHYGNFGNKVKWIGVGGIVTGIGFVVFTLPHFIIGTYHPPDPSVPSFLCTNLNQSSIVQSSMNTSTTSEGCNEGFIAEWYCLALMLVGQFIAGTGSVSLFAFSPACFHEFATHKNLPMFLGLWQASIFLTPIAAFGMSEPLLELYVDITQPEGFDMNPSDPRWIGNWWVGILGASGLSFVFSIFIMGFPRNIPCQRDIRENNLESANVKEKKAQELNFKNIQNKLSELPKILKDLLTNWTFVFNCMAINCVLMYSNGLSPFYAKVIMLHYGVEPEKIGNAMALAAVLPVIVGALLGSILVRTFKFEESGRKSALFCFIFQLFSIGGPLAFLIPGCNEINLAGLHVPYGERTTMGNFSEYPAIPGVDMGSSCNRNCSCHLGIAVPICGSDNVTYLSPCYAGCSNALSRTKFANCTCIESDGRFGTAEVGYCDRDCKNWLWFVALMSFVGLQFCLQLTPAKVVVMRIIPSDRLPLAFGLQYISTKVFAHIPGPILFGHLVDLNCVIWQKVCDKNGFCWIYDLEKQTRLIVTVAGALSGIGILFFLVSWLLYKDCEDLDTTSGVKASTGPANSCKVEDTKV